jgi:Na+-driven multidrug efflux pump
MKLYKTVSLLSVIIFAVVGLLFLFIPNEILRFFNNTSCYFGLPSTPLVGVSFYLILAVGYMYLVTIVAYYMYRNPKNKIFPMLMANGKLASAFLSFYLCIMDKPYLVYITNGVVDGLIGLMALLFYNKLGKMKE